MPQYDPMYVPQYNPMSNPHPICDAEEKPCGMHCCDGNEICARSPYTGGYICQDGGKANFGFSGDANVAPYGNTFGQNYQSPYMVRQYPNGLNMGGNIPRQGFRMCEGDTHHFSLEISSN